MTAGTSVVVVVLPAPVREYNPPVLKPRWDLHVDDVRAVTVRADDALVDLAVERGRGVFTGVHARRALLSPDDAQRLAGCLLAAAAAARGQAAGS